MSLEIVLEYHREQVTVIDMDDVVMMNCVVVAEYLLAVDQLFQLRERKNKIIFLYFSTIVDYLIELDIAHQV